MKKLHRNILFCLFIVSNMQVLVSRENRSQTIENHESKQFITTPLHKAVVRQYFNQHKKLKLIEDLLNEEYDVNARNEDLRTPLWLTSFYGGNIEIVHLLVGYGADVTIPDIFNVTPLHNAIKRNDMQLAEYLLDAGAIMHPRAAEKMINFKDDGKQSPFDLIQIDAIDKDLLNEILHDNEEIQ